MRTSRAACLFVDVTCCACHVGLRQIWDRIARCKRVVFVYPRNAYPFSRVENEQLRALLKQYGIPCPPPGVASPDPAAAGRPPFGMSSSGSFSGSYPPPSSEGHPSRSPPVRGGIGGPSPVHGQRQGPGMGNLTAMLPGEQGMDYATVGVDFVTTYGRQAPYPSPPPHQ